MKYALLSQIVITLLLVAATLTGALAAIDFGVTPVRQTHMLYVTIPGSLFNTDQLEKDYAHLTDQVTGIQNSVLIARQEITSKISNQDSFDSFASLSQRLNFIRQETNEVISAIDGKIVEAENAGSMKYKDYFISLRESANSILPEISAEEERITQYRLVLELESDIHGLQGRYDAAEKQYREFKEQLEQALKDGDSGDVTRYKNKLRDLRQELDVLLDDIQTVFLKIVQRNARDYNDDAQSIKSAVKDLQHDIDDLLKLKKVDRKRGNNSANTIVDGHDFVSPTAAPAVVVRPLDFLPPQDASVQATLDEGQEFSASLWLIAGNVILLAVIIALVLLLV